MDILQLIVNLVSGYERGKEKLFISHIDPIMDQLQTIHKDYIESFEKIRRDLNSKVVPVSELLDFLEERRNSLLHLRDLTIKLAEELEKAERRIVRHDDWEAIKSFCNSVVDYFEASDSVARYSWYSDFIRFMKVSRMAGREDAHFEGKNPFGNDPRADVISHLNVILGRRLPAKMGAVNSGYAQLKAVLM